MLSVGLTGGIGAGKSAVSSALSELGCSVVDADLLAREVVAPGTPGLAAVVRAFGAQVLLPDGALDRPALGLRVFADDEALQTLNAIVHPLVRDRTHQQISAAEAAGAAVLVHDVPLLVENALAPTFHLVVVVDAPVDVRLQRLQGRGLSPEQARARMARQATAEQRRAAADAWLDNAGSRQGLDEQVRALHQQRLVPYARNLANRVPALRPPVQLCEPSPGWAVDGARLTARLRQLCPAASTVEHIGSTAVPGLAAKDVVDLQVEVASWEQVETLAGPLTEGGFPRREDVGGDPVRAELDPDPEQYRKRLHRSADPGRAANVHVRVAGSTGARAAVALRDLLREDASARQAYEVEKRRLAALHPQDVDAYAEGKTALLVPLLRRVMNGGRR